MSPAARLARAAALAGAVLAFLTGSVQAGDSSGGGFSLEGGSISGGTQLSGTGGLSGDAAQTVASGSPGNLSGGTIVAISGGGGISLLSRLINNTVTSANRLSVMVPALAAPSDFDLLVNLDPVASPSRVNPATILEADAKLRAAVGAAFVRAPQGIAEISLLQDNSQIFDSTLASNSTVRFNYADANGDGVVDGSNPPVRTKTLALWALDETRGLWVRVPGSTVDSAARNVTALVPHFSVYALIGAADADVSPVYAFPVPWSPNSGNAALGNLAAGIRFTNLPSEGSINIFNLAGERVRTLEIGPASAGVVAWDGRNTSGEEAVSGTYLWIVKSGSNRKTGKLVIIR